MSSTSKISTLAVAGAALTLALAGCSFGHSGPALTLPGGPSGNYITMTQSDVKPGDVNSFGGMIVCLNKPGTVTITDVRPTHVQGHVKVVEWGVRPSPTWKWTPPENGWDFLGDAKGNLERNHFRYGRTVDINCGGARGYELAVALEMPDDAGFKINDLTVSYLSAGQHRSMVYPQGLAMCPGSVTGAPSLQCAAR